MSGFFANTKSPSNANCVGFVVVSSNVLSNTLPSPLPCRLVIILNATWYEVSRITILASQVIGLLVKSVLHGEFFRGRNNVRFLC